MCWSQTNTYRYIQHHSVPAKTKWEIEYKPTTLQTKKKKKNGGGAMEAVEEWKILLVMDSPLKHKNAYCTYSESLNSTRSASFRQSENSYFSLLEEDTQRYKNREGVGKCVCALVNWVTTKKRKKKGRRATRSWQEARVALQGVKEGGNCTAHNTYTERGNKITSKKRLWHK